MSANQRPRVARWFFLSLVVLLIAAVVLISGLRRRHPMKATRPAEPERQVQAAAASAGTSNAEYIEAGRLLLNAGQPQQAAAWLFHAYQQGDRDPLLRHLLAEALRLSATSAVRLPVAQVQDGDLSGDGRLAAVVDEDGILTLHDADSGRLLQTLSEITLDEPTGDAHNVLFLRDGKRLLSVHRKENEMHEEIQRWQQPQPGAPFENQDAITGPDVGSGAIRRLLVSPDERYLLLHAKGNWEEADWTNLVLYDLTTGEPVRDEVELGAKKDQERERYVQDAAFSQDGSQILILDQLADDSDEDASTKFSDFVVAKIVDTKSGKRISQVSERATGIAQAQLSPDMQRLLTRNDRGEVKVWQVSDGRLLFALGLREARTAQVPFVLNWLADRSRELKLTVHGGIELHERWGGKIDLKTARADRAEYVENGALIAVRMVTGELVHFDAATGACRSTRCGAGSSPSREQSYEVAELADDAVTAANVAGSRRLFAAVTGGQAHGRKLVIQSGAAWITKKPAPGAVTPIPEKTSISGITLNRDGAFGAHFSRKVAVLWSAATGQVLHRWPTEGPSYEPGQLALSSDGQRVAVALPSVWSSATVSSQPAVINVWEAAGDKPIFSFPSETASIRQIAFSPSGALLAVRTAEEIKLYPISGGPPVHTYKQLDVQHLAWSTDNQRLALLTTLEARVIDVATGKQVRSWPSDGLPLTALAWSPDGRFLIVAGKDGTARVEAIDPAPDANGPVATLVGHHGAITGVDFSPDGELLLTLGADKTARIWERRSGRQLHLFTSSGPRFQAARFDAKGETVRTLSPEGVMLWDVRPESRQPEQIAAWLRCHVPLQRQGSRFSELPARTPLPAECWPR